jgi:hypothetical protein
MGKIFVGGNLQKTEKRVLNRYCGIDEEFTRNGESTLMENNKTLNK